MLRRFIVAVAAVAALGIGATDASAAWHGHGGGYHGGYGGYGWGGVGAGLVAGALVGSALAAPYYYGPGPYGSLRAGRGLLRAEVPLLLPRRQRVRSAARSRRRPVITFPAPIIDERGMSFDSREQAIMSVLLPAMMAEAHRAVSRSAHTMSAKARPFYFDKRTFNGPHSTARWTYPAEVPAPD